MANDEGYGLAAQRPGLLLAAIWVFFAVTGCLEQKMSLQEAREVTVAMRGKSFTPPPRRIDDILSVLEQVRPAETETLIKARQEADAPEPAGGTDGKLAAFYRGRGKARAEIGRMVPALEDFRNAYDRVQRLGYWDPVIEKELALAEMQVGNSKRALKLFRDHINHAKARGVAYSQLVKLYSRIGDFKAAKMIRDRGTEALERRKAAMLRRGKREPWLDVHLGQIEFWYLTGLGKHAEAEPHIRKAISGWEAKADINPSGPALGNLFLASNLIKQGRPVEAEVVARDAVQKALAVGKEAGVTGYALWGLGAALLTQGRVAEAEKVYRASVEILDRLGYPDDSMTKAWGRIHLGEALAARKQYQKALSVFQKAREGMVANRFLYTNFFERRPDVIFTHIMAGEADAALEMIGRSYPVVSRGMGTDSFAAAQLRALRGMAHAKKNELEAALADFSSAMPILARKRKAVENYAGRVRRTLLLESYMDVLHLVQGNDLASDYGIDPAQEAFRMSEVLSNGSVQKALGASGARAAVNDPELADLVRREQDTGARIRSLQQTLSDILASPPDQQDAGTRETVKETIVSLEKARETLDEEIRKRFPKYADFVDPKPVDFATLQRLLHTGEALVVCTTTETRTYAWAIPPRGRVLFSSADLGREEMQQKVDRLREALDPGPGTFGQIPPFDLDTAYGIYEKVLAPVAPAWNFAKEIVTAVAGPLSQIPLGILPTKPMTAQKSAPEVLFEDYRRVPWLIRKAAITRAPSAAAFALQRQVPPGRSGRRAFAGFGDPIYNPGQIAQTGLETVHIASRGGGLHVRGVRVTQKGSLDSQKVLSSQIELLNRLPDTAEEIQSIARTMEADPGSDIFLGVRASETTVKAMDLADRRVIAFASHALVPGDLNGLDQPALALSAPSVTGQPDDGLLTMGEVMQLELDADWVVLSACNTGAAGGAGEEAISGLGRAFFYAGTRALLVSMWPVETTSAKKLTTGLFQIQQKNPGLSRAGAFRQSILDLMDGPGIRDEATGKIVASYAHPLFWAPFIIVGDSGGKE